MFYNDAKNEAIGRAKRNENEYNELGRHVNSLAMNLYSQRKTAARAIYRVERYINFLANTPKQFLTEIAEVIMSLREFQEAVKIEEEGNSANMTGAGMAIGGTAVGGAVAALGPTAAMAIATTFGTASTGTAIASLSGAAATKAALAWLGGGALAAGGGGMAAGNAFLALAGPVGWGIAGTMIVGGGLFASFKNKKVSEKADRYARELREKISVLKPKAVRMEQLEKETSNLTNAISVTPFNLFPNDYIEFSQKQKDALAALVNNTKALGKLINERIS